MPDIPLLLAAIVVIALAFDYTNGAHDCGNAIATVNVASMADTLAIEPHVMEYALHLTGHGSAEKSNDQYLWMRLGAAA